MAPTLQIATLLAIIATTAAFFPAVLVPRHNCKPHCPKREICIAQQVECFAAPCNPILQCSSKGDEYLPNPCDANPCPKGFSCIPAKASDQQIAVCVSPCMKKKCGRQETCVMTTDYEGNEKPECVPVSHKCSIEPTTCAATSCPVNTDCRMVGCMDAECVPFYALP